MQNANKRFWLSLGDTLKKGDKEFTLIAGAVPEFFNNVNY